MNLKSFTDRVKKFCTLPGYFVRCNALRQVIAGGGSFRSGSFKIENLKGRHVVTGGLLVYLTGFLIGIGSTGVSIEATDAPGYPDTGGLPLPEVSEAAELQDMAHLLSDRDLLESSGDMRCIKDPDNTVSKTYWPESGMKKNQPAAESTEMNVPGSFLKKIFLNNLGLNMIIVTGAFSLLAFSMIVIVFNALHIGMLVKGIYNSYGFKLAAVLVLPHLVVELISHFLSLYLAYILLRQIIVPVVVRGEGRGLIAQKARDIPVLFLLIVIITFMAALVEIYVTPKLI